MDRSFNGVIGHIGYPGVLYRHAKTGIGIRVGATFFGSNGDLFVQFGIDLSPPCILSTFSSLDIRPHTMSGDKKT